MFPQFDHLVDAHAAENARKLAGLGFMEVDSGLKILTRLSELYLAHQGKQEPLSR